MTDGNNIEVQSIDNSTIEIPSWDQYDKIVLVLISIEREGTGYPYSISANYEPSPIATSIYDDIGDGSFSYSLDQNYPNPFNLATMINYKLATANIVSLNVYNSMGQKVRELASGLQSPGRHQVQWDGRDNNRILSNGVYYYELKVDNYRSFRKMILLK